MNDRAYIINHDGHKSKRTQWITLCVNSNKIAYFDSFRVGHISKEFIKLIGNKDVKTNIFRIQAYNSIMCGYFCI